jgi:nanoRNase/pAp phosphatase (c-di-AMP/oligoRNAs hydrolase)
MLEYGGGGHEAAGTCQVANDSAGGLLQTLVNRITRVASKAQFAAS